MVGAFRFEDEDLLKGAWLNGVRDSIREELLMSPAITLTEMMKLSVKVERRNAAWKEEGLGPLGRNWSQGANRGGLGHQRSSGLTESKAWASNQVGSGSQSRPNNLNPNLSNSLTASASSHVGHSSPWVGTSENTHEGDTTKTTNSVTGVRAGENLSQSEWRERESKGLCFKCGEKWHPNHKCQIRQMHLLLIEEDEEEKGEENGEGNETI